MIHPEVILNAWAAAVMGWLVDAFAAVGALLLVVGLLGGLVSFRRRR